MKSKREIFNLLKSRILILDGATGTQLQKHGMPAGVSPEVWCVDNPKAVRDIHAEYQKSGSDIVYTCTFGANRCKLEQFGVKNAAALNKELAQIAGKAVGGKALTAGDIGPTGRFVEPFGDLEFEEAVDIFKEQAAGLIDGGVDLFVIETMLDIQEARAALIAVKELTDCFTIVSLTYEEDGRTLGGTDALTALITLQSLGADAVGCNCSSGPEAMLKLVKAMKPYAKVPLIAKPNAGMPKLVDGKTVFDMDPLKFASFAGDFAGAGINMLGGCCGTTPGHILEMKKKISEFKPQPPNRRHLSALSSARKHIFINQQGPLLIVGERINPTGKKDLQEELKNGQLTAVRRFARDQEKQGADLLDVNIGTPGIDEIKTIRSVIGTLSIHTELPLVIDSSKIETIEAALRIYPGRALINSISGEKEKINKMLPIAAKYGAMFILLPITDKEIPETKEGRQIVIKDVLREARNSGFSKDDIIVDALVMAVASNAGGALETLKTVSWLAKTLKIKTIAGLSNISFGMPERKWLNVAFLAMAQGMGLTMAIANPADEELMKIKLAGDVLMNKDKDASSYIRHVSKQKPKENLAISSENASPVQKLHDAILEGNREDIVKIIEEVFTAGEGQSRLVDDVMIPAIIRVGELYERKIYFLPQLIASAEAMKKGIDHIQRMPQQRDNLRGKKGIVLLATVRGDIHDIGKNIVALMLRNHGYEIVDLGKDVPTEKIIDSIRELRPHVAGLSALMTTTMINMKEVVDRSKSEGLSCPFIVGGAVVTDSFASSIGAVYAKDGVDAIRVIDRLIKT